MVRLAQALDVGLAELGDRLDHGELWYWRLEPGDVHEAEAHLPGTVEMLHVLDGDLTLAVDLEVHPAARTTVGTSPRAGPQRAMP